MNKVIKETETGISTPRTVAVILEGMMSKAAEVANEKAALEIKRIARANAFLELADDNGFTPKDIMTNLQDAIDLAKKGGDSRALTRLVELQNKMFLEVHQSVGDTVLKLTQIQNNMDKGQGGGDKMSELEMQKLVYAEVEKIVNGG